MSPRASSAGVRRGAPARFALPVAASLKVGDTFDDVPANSIVPDAIARDPIPFTAPKPQTPTVQLAQVTVEDIDQLWDWVRSDREGVASFLSATYQNSQAFFARIGQIIADEQSGTAFLRSVRDGDTLAGFVMLAPIINGCATVHLYLTPKTPTKVMTSVIEALPRNIQLMLVAPSAEFAAMFDQHGFTAKLVLTRPASEGAKTGDGRAD